MILKPSKIDENLNLLYPSSHCSICKKPIRFYENIPILSYLILRGKCPNCNNTSLEDYYPFCSQKCSDLDLYKWLSDQNSINLDQKE